MSHPTDAEIIGRINEQLTLPSLAQSGGNDPAFPVEVTNKTDGTICGVQTGSRQGWEVGLTKRELFAALAMLTLRADESDTEHDIAKAAVSQADALLEVLAGSAQQAAANASLLDVTRRSIGLLERFAYICELLPKPLVGEWNWPELASEARELVAEAKGGAS